MAEKAKCRREDDHHCYGVRPKIAPPPTTRTVSQGLGQMTSLSIVIASLNRTVLLEQTLASVLQNRPQSSEIIVVHRGVYNDPYELGSEIQFEEKAEDCHLAEMLNEGIQKAEGEIVHILMAGLEVEEGWCKTPIQWFEHAVLASVVPIVLDGIDRQIVASLGVKPGPLMGRNIVAEGQVARESKLQRLQPLGPSISAGFFRKSALLAVGGFDASLTVSLIDLDMALALQESGFVTKADIDSKLFTDENSELMDLATPMNEGRSAQRLLGRYREELTSIPFPIATGLGIAATISKSILSPEFISIAYGRATGLFQADDVQRGWEVEDGSADVLKISDAKANQSDEGSDEGSGDRSGNEEIEIRRAA